jgi:hypothetical protein
VRRDKNTAVKLRLEGQSYGQIQRVLPGISKSTLSLWLKNVEITKEAQAKIATRSREKSLEGLLKKNKNQTFLAIQRREAIMRESQKEIKELSVNSLFLVGLALYWAEGYKRIRKVNGREITSHPISLTNADPVLVQMFLRFIREICKVPEEKIHADLRIFKHMDEGVAVDYWEQVTKIPPTRFGKVHIFISQSSRGKRPFNRLPFGVIQIRINDTQLFHKIMGWIEGLKQFSVPR